MAETKMKRKIPICPISLANPNGSQVCAQENCAWWVSSTKTCLANVIAHNNILDIKQKQGK